MCGSTHVPGCHHELYMRQGVERFLAHPRTREALRLALSSPEHAAIQPAVYADQILVELARVGERLDGMSEDVDGREEPESVALWTGELADAGRSL